MQDDEDMQNILDEPELLTHALSSLEQIKRYRKKTHEREVLCGDLQSLKTLLLKYLTDEEMIRLRQQQATRLAGQKATSEMIQLMDKNGLVSREATFATVCEAAHR